jgi:hypothetical protein
VVFSQVGLICQVLVEDAPYAGQGRTGFGDQLINGPRGYLALYPCLIVALKW